MGLKMDLWGAPRPVDDGEFSWPTFLTIVGVFLVLVAFGLFASWHSL
jgi:hypothetical protein